MSTLGAGEARPAAVREVAEVASDRSAIGAVAVGGAAGAVLGAAVGGARAVASGAVVGAFAGVAVQNVLETRRAWAVTQKTLARMVGCSERTLAEWEAKGVPDRGDAHRRLTEMVRLHRALTRVLPGEEVAGWVERPNAALDGATPLQAIEAGQVDRLYGLVFYAESGMPG